MRNWHYGVYVASSTGGISGHLSKRHGIEEPKDESPSLPPTEPIQEEEEDIYCKECGHRKGTDIEFNSVQYRQKYVDWVIRHNIAFYTATQPDTLELLRVGAEDVMAEILPKAKGSISS